MEECKKTKFASEKEALVRLGKIKNRPQKEVFPIRAYLCRCLFWHLTSRLDVKDIQKENENLKLVNIKLIEELRTLKSEQNKINSLGVSVNKIVIKQKEQIKSLQAIIEKMLVFESMLEKKRPK